MVPEFPFESLVNVPPTDPTYHRCGRLCRLPYSTLVGWRGSDPTLQWRPASASQHTAPLHTYPIDSLEAKERNGIGHSLSSVRSQVSDLVVDVGEESETCPAAPFRDGSEVAAVQLHRCGSRRRRT